MSRTDESDIQNLYEGLKTIKSLKSLNLINFDVIDHNSEIFCQNLKEVKSLTILSFEINYNIFIQEETIKSLASVFQELKNLTKLKVKIHRTTSENITEIPNSTFRLHETSIKHLELSFPRDLEDKQILAIFDLRNIKSLTSISLDIIYYRVTEGIKDLEEIKNHLKCLPLLSTLTMYVNYYEEKNDAFIQSTCFLSELQTLTSIHIRIDNNSEYLKEENIKSLCTTLKDMKSLQRLGLDFTRSGAVSVLGVDYLKELLQGNILLSAKISLGNEDSKIVTFTQSKNF